MKLKIQNPVTNRWEYADMFSGNGSVIALKFEANPIGELKHRKADTSNLVKLPRTPRNAQLLGYPADMHDAYRRPYKHVECTVEQDGMPVFGKGSYLQIVEVTNEHYEVKIYSGIANFFTAIKDKNLRELSKDFIRKIKWNVEGVKALFDANNPEVVFPIIDWDKNKKNDALSEGGSTDFPSVDVRKLYPCVKLRALLQAICAGQGYSLQLLDLNDDEVFNNTAVPCVNGYAMPLDFSLGVTYVHQKNEMTPKKYYAWGNIDQENMLRYWKYSEADNDPEKRRLCFTAPTRAKYAFEITSSIQYFNSQYVEFYVIVKGTAQRIVRRQQYVGAVELKAGDTVEFELKYKPVNSSISNPQYPAVNSMEIRYTLYKQITDADNYGNENFPVINNLPDVPQLDLFKEFCLNFGQMVYIDERTKTVYCYGWKTLFNNAKNGNIVNWSAKLDDRQTKQNFLYGNYGQKSYIKRKESEYTTGDNEDIKVTDEGILVVDNKHLDERKDLFELKSLALTDVQPFAGKLPINIAKIPYRRAGEADNGNDAPFTFVHLNNYSDEGYTILKLTGNGGSDRNRDCIKVVYADFTTIKVMNLLAGYYNYLQNNILTDCRVLSERIWLQAADIVNFRHEVPVYLSKYGMYFYANKINNYKGGLTEVELITLYP